MEPSVYELVKSLKVNKDKALVELIDRFNPLINSLSRKLDYYCADTDILIAFINIVSNCNIENYISHNDGPIVRYIEVCLNNRFNDLYKTKKSKNNSAIEEIEINLDVLKSTNLNDSYEDLISNIDFFNIIDSVSLTEKQRAVIIKSFLRDLSDLEISNQLKISRQAVNKTKNQALKVIKQYLEAA